MDETNVGGTKRRYSYDYGDRGNFIHDIDGTRKQLALVDVHRNDWNPSDNTSSRNHEWEYKVKIAAISAGLFFSGIIFSVIQVIGK